MIRNRPLKSKSFKDLILKESDRYIIINKPPYISSLDDRSSEQNILSLARMYCGEAKLCHRLDKETSGLLVVAKTDQFYKYFSQLLEQRDVTKLYHAVIQSVKPFEEFEIDTPLHTTSNKSRVDFTQGKPSVTLVSTLDIYKQHSLVACMPFTGRMHQIRVHLSSIGVPICGDHKYLGKDIYLSHIKRKYRIGKGKEEHPLMRRMALHAAGISFRDDQEDHVQLTAPYPKDFEVLLKQLEKNRG